MELGGGHLDTSHDTYLSFLVEDEDFSILLAALESRCVADQELGLSGAVEL